MTQKTAKAGITDFVLLLLPVAIFFCCKEDILQSVHKFSMIHSQQSVSTNGLIRESDFDADDGSYDFTINYAVESTPFVLKETIAIDSTGDLAKGQTVQVRYHKNKPSLATIDFNNNINGYFVGVMLVTLGFFLWAVIRLGRKLFWN